MNVSIIGNSPTNAGVAMAADLALSGREVRLARWTEAELDFEAIRRNGGIDVRGDPRHLVSGRLGKAQLHLENDIAAAARHADLIVVDLVPTELEQRLRLLAPHLRAGQVLHVNTCSYWCALRAAVVLDDAVRDGLTITELIAPTLTAGYQGAQLETKWLRHKLPVAAFPSVRAQAALTRVQTVYPMLRAASNVLETSLANLNMLVHAAIALINIGWFDRAVEKGETVDFWMGGSTPHAQRLAEAQDLERRRVCDAFGIAWESTAAHLGNTYGGAAAGFRDAIRDCAFYRSLPPRSPELWRRWLDADTAMAHVPLAECARTAGVAVPLHDSYIGAFSALLGRDFARDGLTLDKLGLGGASVQQMIDYVRTGER